MKGVKHYTEDGKEWDGSSHKMDDGTLHTGATHTKSSEILVHKKELKKPSGFKMAGFPEQAGVSPLKRCWKGYKPNPDGRAAKEQGSCVKE